MGGIHRSQTDWQVSVVEGNGLQWGWRVSRAQNGHSFTAAGVHRSSGIKQQWRPRGIQERGALTQKRGKGSSQENEILDKMMCARPAKGPVLLIRVEGRAPGKGLSEEGKVKMMAGLMWYTIVIYRRISDRDIENYANFFREDNFNLNKTRYFKKRQMGGWLGGWVKRGGEHSP